MFNIVRRYILIFMIFALVWPTFISAQTQNQLQNKISVLMPQTPQEAKALGLRILEGLPSAMKKVWEEEVLPVWAKMWEWSKPYIKSWGKQLLKFLGRQVKKQEPQLKQQLKQEAGKVQEGLWEKFKDLFK